MNTSSRIMTFETITDNRFDKDVIKLCEENATKIKMELDKLDGVSYEMRTMTTPHFPDGTQQARIRFYIRKCSRKITWNDIYKAINRVKPAVYKFI